MADAAVRPASADDGDEVARIQLATWRIAYADRLPAGVLDGVEPEAAATRWRESIASPPTARHRTLVAYEGAPATTVGFAASGPADDDDVSVPDGATVHDPAKTVLVATMLVEPRWGRRGHGSRLLAATVDLARADGAEHAITWLFESDTASLAFYRSAGWEVEGTVRELSTGTELIREVRLHASLL